MINWNRREVLKFSGAADTTRAVPATDPNTKAVLYREDGY